MIYLKSKLISQEGLYSVVLVSVISFVFLVVSLNLGKNIQSYIGFETVSKETLLRERVVRVIQEHLSDLPACSASFNKGASIESKKLRNKKGKVIFDLSKLKREDRGFTEEGLPRAREIKIRFCDLSSFKSGLTASDCKPPPFVQDEDSFYHSASTLQIDFSKSFLTDQNNPKSPKGFYPVYIPIYLKTKTKPSDSPTRFEECSTFTSLVRNFRCPPMLFDFSCCRYIYKMELKSGKVNAVNPRVSGDDFLAGSTVYSQTKEPGQHFEIIPTAENPEGTRASADEDCQSSAKKAFMSAVCSFAKGWNIHTQCLK